MAGPMTTMFGKAYDTVGSADKNLILLTRGDLKVKWGNKFINLIKDGKINVDIDFLKQVDSKEAIYKDGVYLIKNEDKQEVWLQIGDNLVNLIGEISTEYVSFMSLLTTKAENKLIALKNVGFFYETIEDALKDQIQSGLVYILGEQQLYKIKDGNYSKYDLEIEISDPLVLHNLTINGANASITGASELYLSVNTDNYISIGDNKITLDKDIIVSSDLLSDDYVIKESGYRIYVDTDGTSTLEIDKVIVRKILEYDDTPTMTYLQLRTAMTKGTLIPKKKYKIIDFLNEWEITKDVVYEDEKYITPAQDGSLGRGKNVWPIIVKALTKTTLYKDCTFADNEDWYAEYDPSFYYFIRTETIDGEDYNLFSKGRITLLRDENNNECNYDFKHKLFKYTSTSDDINQWYYTYNIINTEFGTNLETPYIYSNVHVNADASQIRNTKIKNNKIYIPEPVLEDITITQNGLQMQTKKIVDLEQFIIFPDCITLQPYNNEILKSSGMYAIKSQFYGNSIKGLLLNIEEPSLVEFNFDFYDNVFNNIYFAGDSLGNAEPVTTFTQGTKFYKNSGLDIVGTTFTKTSFANTFQNIINCIIDAPMENNIFDKDLQLVNFKCNQMLNNHITGTIYTDNDPESYPIEAGMFNDNVINNISKSKIMCLNCSFIKNIFNNIIGYFFDNSNVTNNEGVDLIGDDSGTGGYDPYNPGGGDTPIGTGIIVEEPTRTAVNDKMHGIFTTSSMHANTAESDVRIGYIDPVDESYGTPTVYGIYVVENGNMLNFQSIRFSKTASNGYDVYGNFIANELTTNKRVRVWIQFAAVSEIGYINVYQAAGSSSSDPSSDDPPSGDSSSDADVDEYLNTFKSSSLASTTLGDSKYALLSTAMDKLDSFESNVMSDSMFVDDALTLPSGNSAETRNARRGWYMALLLTALYPIKSSVANNDILSDAMSTWGISQSTNTNTYSVSTYEARYKGLLQGSIAFSCLFGDSSFVNSFVSHASYTYLGSDGDLGPESRANAPAGQYFFPYPPTNDINATSGLMKRDEDAFKHGLDLRSTSRGTTALNDRDTDLSYFLSILQTATGKNNGSGSAYTFMHDTQWDGKRTVNNIKDTPSYWRSRPAWENNDTSVDGSPTESGTTYSLNFGTASGKSGSTSYTTSYPSGHTGYFWNTAYCFAAIGGLSSSAIVNLFKRAYQYSESRVIVGAHWQMCIEMGRIAAACSFATLCGNAKFIQELQAALN